MQTDLQKPFVRLISSAIFLALGMLLPLITGQLPQINRVLLPMHIPVFLCGILCGWQYGLCIGAILPILKSAVFGLPVMFPSAIAMVFEMGLYGLVCGLIYRTPKELHLPRLYLSLSVAMILGRAARFLAELALLGLSDSSFKLASYLSVTLLPSIPGALLHLIIIPPIIALLHRIKLL